MRIFRGILGNAILMVFLSGLQFAVMLVMMRLLDASAYGKFALVSSTVSFLAILSARPMLEYIPVAQGKISSADYFWMTGFLQAVPISIIVFLASRYQPFRVFDGVSSLLLFCTVYYLVDWFASFHVAHLQREMRFTRLQVLQGSGAVLSAIGGITLAFAGYHALSLVVQITLSISAYACDFIYSRWNRVLEIPASIRRFDIRQVSPGLRYGWFRTVSGVFSGSRVMLESSAIAGESGFALLGSINRATALPNQFLSRVPQLLTGVLQPVLASKQAQGLDRVQRANRLVLNATCWTVIPLAVVLQEVGGWLAELLYGPDWGPIIPLIAVASLLCAIQLFLQIGASMLNARGHSGATTLVDGVVFGGILVALLAVLRHGAYDYLRAVTLFYGLALVVMFVMLIRTQQTTFEDVAHAALLPAAVLEGGLGLLHLAAPAFSDVHPVVLAGRCILLLAPFVLSLRFLSAERLTELLEAAGVRSFFPPWTLRATSAS